MQGTTIVKRRQVCHIFAFKLVAQNCHRDKETRFGFTEFPVLCQATAGNDTVHMYMILQILVPCVKDLYDAGCCPEPLLISR